MGQVLVLDQMPEGGWWCGTIDGSGASGWFPSNHVKELVIAVPAPLVGSRSSSPRVSSPAGSNPRISSPLAIPPPASASPQVQQQAPSAASAASPSPLTSSLPSGAQRVVQPAARISMRRSSSLSLTPKMGSLSEEPGASSGTDDAPPVHVAKHAFEPRNEDELALAKGDQVIVISSPSGGWWQGHLVGSTTVGWFPANHVEEAPSASAPATPASAARSSPSVASPSAVLHLTDDLEDSSSVDRSRASIRSDASTPPGAVPTRRRSQEHRFSSKASQETKKKENKNKDKGKKEKEKYRKLRHEKVLSKWKEGKSKS